ncbi:MAG: glyoxalase/bleomycin resistance/extradiol dioxygenase family protein [Sphingomonadales bacterium]|nr:glyoxalase/bleomycin resistance/extradiol dioxygenase family protein [Sphingomonadales bacterium]
MAEPAPQVTSGLTPHLSIPDNRAKEAVDFYKKAFGATERFRLLANEPMGGEPARNPDDTRVMHAHLLVNGASLLLNDQFPEYAEGRSQTPGALTLHLHVDDADAWYDRAVKAGGTALMPLSDMFWGDRYGQVQDPFGYIWAIAAPVK